MLMGCEVTWRDVWNRMQFTGRFLCPSHPTDEPTGGLDEVGTRSEQEELRRVELRNIGRFLDEGGRSQGSRLHMIELLFSPTTIPSRVRRRAAAHVHACQTATGFTVISYYSKVSGPLISLNVTDPNLPL